MYTTASTSSKYFQKIKFHYNMLRNHIKNIQSSKMSEETHTRCQQKPSTRWKKSSILQLSVLHFLCISISHRTWWCVMYLHQPPIHHWWHTFTRSYEVSQYSFYYNYSTLVVFCGMSSSVYFRYRVTTVKNLVMDVLKRLLRLTKKKLVGRKTIVIIMKVIWKAMVYVMYYTFNMYVYCYVVIKLL